MAGDTVTRSGPALQLPTEVSSSNGQLAVTLTAREYELDTGAFTMKSKAYCYNDICSHTPPTLRFLPGDTVTITLVNELPATQNSPSDLGHTADHVNVHTHGGCRLMWVAALLIVSVPCRATRGPLGGQCHPNCCPW